MNGSVGSELEIVRLIQRKNVPSAESPDRSEEEKGRRRKGDEPNNLGFAVVDSLFRVSSAAKCGFESELFGGCLLPCHDSEPKGRPRTKEARFTRVTQSFGCGIGHGHRIDFSYCFVGCNQRHRLFQVQSSARSTMVGRTAFRSTSRKTVSR